MWQMSCGKYTLLLERTLKVCLILKEWAYTLLTSPGLKHTEKRCFLELGPGPGASPCFLLSEWSTTAQLTDLYRWRWPSLLTSLWVTNLAAIPCTSCPQSESNSCKNQSHGTIPIIEYIVHQISLTKNEMTNTAMKTEMAMRGPHHKFTICNLINF